jgi:putative ABC transport system permease protein
MFQFLDLMFKNALRNPRRSLLTIFSMSLSLCLLGVLMALYFALFLAQEDTPAQARRAVTRHKVSLALVMPAAYKQKILAVPGVEKAMIYQWFGGVYKEPKNFFARFAAEPEDLFTIYSDWKIPEEQKKAFQSEKTACLVGSQLANKFGFKLGDRITLQGDIFPVNLDLTVRGIYQAYPDDEVLWFHLKYLTDALPAGRRDFAGTFNILVDRAENVPVVAKQIDTMFRNSPVPTRTESEREFQRSFVSLLGNLKLILMAICGAVVFTILLVSANTMAMSVRDRIREVGVLKTLGFTNGGILTLLLGEAAVLALMGGALGLVLASILCAGLRQAPAFLSETKTLAISPPVAIACLAVALVIGVVSAFIPAYTAARTNILDSLKYTG